MDKRRIESALRIAAAKLEEAWAIIRAEPSQKPKRVQTLSDSLDWPVLEPPSTIHPHAPGEALVRCRCCATGLLPAAEMDRWSRREGIIDG